MNTLARLLILSCAAVIALSLASTASAQTPAPKPDYTPVPRSKWNQPPPVPEVKLDRWGRAESAFACFDFGPYPGITQKTFGVTNIILCGDANFMLPQPSGVQAPAGQKWVCIDGPDAIRFTVPFTQPKCMFGTEGIFQVKPTVAQYTAGLNASKKAKAEWLALENQKLDAAEAKKKPDTELFKWLWGLAAAGLISWNLWWWIFEPIYGHRLTRQQKDQIMRRIGKTQYEKTHKPVDVKKVYQDGASKLGAKDLVKVGKAFEGFHDNLGRSVDTWSAEQQAELAEIYEQKLREVGYNEDLAKTSAWSEFGKRHPYGLGEGATERIGDVGKDATKAAWDTYAPTPEQLTKKVAKKGVGKVVKKVFPKK